jgi:4-hydroxy-3-methylbut-2-enyl diphosphate reductase
LREEWLRDIHAIGITAGASAPDGLVQDLIAELGRRGPTELTVLSGIEENVRFRMPSELADSAA